MDRDSAFVGGIPDIYEDVLGPILFEPFARAVAQGFAGFEGRMLETAAGTGRLTRALLAAAPNAKIVATDLNAPMLEKAASLVGGDRVTWQTADALALPFDNGVFDAVACQFGVMFFPDRVRGYKEARRVLRTGGAFTF
ncbi:MAG TPA: class I SAM-dependent methyltransferase, partial [Caulobacteraceae bacterium]|nr:class I SAM-dependent methyltransferase [Caulobacteraceae bacterium]